MGKASGVLRLEEVRPYYDILYERRGQLAVKRIFDFLMAGILLIILAIPMAGIALIIRMDSPGAAFYRQERITAYGQEISNS